MSNNHDGGPAFPGREYESRPFTMGMSLRDWYAGMALQAILSGVDLPESFRMLERRHIEKRSTDISMCAYALADAMLKARDRS